MNDLESSPNIDMKQRNEIITQMIADKSLFQAVKEDGFKKEIDAGKTFPIKQAFLLICTQYE